jgi:hypothetical protein
MPFFALAHFPVAAVPESLKHRAETLRLWRYPFYPDKVCIAICITAPEFEYVRTLTDNIYIFGDSAESFAGGMSLLELCPKSRLPASSRASTTVSR